MESDVAAAGGDEAASDAMATGDEATDGDSIGEGGETGGGGVPRRRRRTRLSRRSTRATRRTSRRAPPAPELGLIYRDHAEIEPPPQVSGPINQRSGASLTKSNLHLVPATPSPHASGIRSEYAPCLSIYVINAFGGILDAKIFTHQVRP